MKSMIINIKRLLIKPQYYLHFIIYTSYTYIFNLRSIIIINNNIIELNNDKKNVLLTKNENNDINPKNPNNAKNHINNTLNTHNDFNRILINIDHPSNKPNIFLTPQITKYIKKHQIKSNTFKIIKINFINKLNFFITIIVNYFLFVNR